MVVTCGATRTLGRTSFPYHCHRCHTAARCHLMDKLPLLQSGTTGDTVQQLQQLPSATRQADGSWQKVANEIATVKKHYRCCR